MDVSQFKNFKLPKNVFGNIRILAYIALFVVSFLFFLYLTFPYGVLKEAMREKIAIATGYDVHIDKLGPRLLFGLTAEGVQLGAPGGVSLKVKAVKVGLNPFALLLGRVGGNIAVVSAISGDMVIHVSSGIFGLLSGNPGSLSVSVDASDFSLDDISRFALQSQANDPTTNPLLAPMLQSLTFTGKMNADIDLDLNINDPSKSKGNVDLSFKQAVLKLVDPNLNLSDQVFSKALIKAGVENAKLSISPDSGLLAPELDIKVSGKCNLKPNLAASDMDINIAIKLDKSLKDNLGVILDAVAGGKKDGAMSLQLVGPIAHPQMNKL